MSAKAKRAIVSCFAAALIAGAVAAGVPLDAATAVVASVSAFLLGAMHVDKPKD